MLMIGGSNHKGEVWDEFNGEVFEAPVYEPILIAKSITDENITYQPLKIEKYFKRNITLVVLGRARFRDVFIHESLADDFTRDFYPHLNASFSKAFYLYVTAVYGPGY